MAAQSSARSHVFNPTILREYDIRGTVGETLSEADALGLGRAFATVLAGRGHKTVAVGRDGRLSSPSLEAALVKGLSECGIDVVRVGLGPTPMLYFAAVTLPVGGGIMVTGSHNPPDQNGFKLVLEKKSFFGPDIQHLGRLAAAGEFPRGEGRVTDHPIIDAHVARLMEEAPKGRALKVVWDAGSGATGDVLRKLTAQLPGTHILLNDEIDGRFPVHHPDPTEAKNLVQIQAEVLKQGADIGIAFDGDGDRIGIVDSKARIVWGDQMMAMLAADVLRDRPGSIIIADVKASQVLFDEIARLGGKPMMWKTGHSIIKARMAEVGAPFAGEMSGHIFFADRFYGYDDAIYAGLRMLGILARGPDDLATLRDRLPQPLNTPETRFACPDTRKFAVVEEVRDRLKAEGADVIDIDGVRVRTPEGWWLLRASNTQAVLVARVEAANEAGMAKLKAALIRQLTASGVAAPEF